MDPADGIVAASADALAGVVRTALRVAAERIARHAAQRAVALAAGVGAVLRALVALLAFLPDAVAAARAPVADAGVALVLDLLDVSRRACEDQREQGSEETHRASTTGFSSMAASAW